jgi:hypothetical protein
MYRRLETLEDPSKPPVTVYTHNVPPALENFATSKPADAPSDVELRGRLQKLRQRLTAAPSVEEIEERLAKLQGMAKSPKYHSIGKYGVCNFERFNFYF